MVWKSSFLFAIQQQQLANKNVEHDTLQGNVAALIENWFIVNGVPSNWTVVTSCAPQGSVFGPFHLVFYINDLDLGLSSMVSTFVDDTKLGIDAADQESVRVLQWDLATIGRWFAVW